MSSKLLAGLLLVIVLAAASYFLIRELQRPSPTPSPRPKPTFQPPPSPTSHPSPSPSFPTKTPTPTPGPQPSEEISPIYVLFVLHFDPPGTRAGECLSLNGYEYTNNYMRSRDELAWLLDFAKRTGVRMTALFNGFYPQLAIRRNELDLLARLIQEGHEIGTHAHSIYYDEAGDRWCSVNDPEMWFKDAKACVDQVVSLVGGENRVMCAMFGRGMYENEDDLMKKYGYDIGLGNRPEIALNFLGHIVWNPWRAKCSNDYSRALEEDPSVPFVSIDHRSQIGSTSAHGGVDSRSDTLKKMFLMAFVEWKVHEIMGDSKVWCWGVVHHPNYGEIYNDHIEDFFGWLNKHFIGIKTPKGNTVAAYATASQVAEAFYRWEKEHPGKSSFSYVEGQPYPYLCKYSRDKLIDATYLGELNLGEGIYAFKFSSGRGTFILAWYNGEGEVTVDLAAAGVMSGQVVVTTPTGESSTTDASNVVLSELPVFIEKG